MTALRCVVCPQPITGAHLRLTWEGLETSRTLNGTTMYAHFMCVLLQRQPGGEPLPTADADPDPEEAEPGTVLQPPVYQAAGRGVSGSRAWNEWDD